MMKSLSWLITLPLLFFLVIFALSNRTLVSISFWPFDLDATLPVSLLAFGLFACGVLFGSFAAWLAFLPKRCELRRVRREVEALKKPPLTPVPSGRLYQTVLLPEAPLAPPPKKSWLKGFR